MNDKMTPEEAGDKGKLILEHLAEIYTLIDWYEGSEEGDPFVKVTFLKSGKLLIENYKDAEPAEFTMEQILRDND